MSDTTQSLNSDQTPESKLVVASGLKPNDCSMCGSTNVKVTYDELRDALKMKCGYCNYIWWELTLKQRKEADNA